MSDDGSAHKHCREPATAVASLSLRKRHCLLAQIQWAHAQGVLTVYGSKAHLEAGAHTVVVEEVTVTSTNINDDIAERDQQESARQAQRTGSINP